MRRVCNSKSRKNSFPPLISTTQNPTWSPKSEVTQFLPILHSQGPLYLRTHYWAVEWGKNSSRKSQRMEWKRQKNCKQIENTEHWKSIMNTYSLVCVFNKLGPATLSALLSSFFYPLSLQHWIFSYLLSKLRLYASDIYLIDELQFPEAVWI